jgi:hypothetical protein
MCRRDRPQHRLGLESHTAGMSGERLPMALARIRRPAARANERNCLAEQFEERSQVPGRGVRAAPHLVVEWGCCSGRGELEYLRFRSMEPLLEERLSP